MSKAEATTIHFPHYAKIPKRDPVTHNPIPEPEPLEYDVSKYEYVTIPEEDIFGKPHQGVTLNGVHFARGQKYFIEPDIADEVRERLAVGQKADMRILQSHPDAQAVRDQQRNTTNPSAAYFSPNVGE